MDQLGPFVLSDVLPREGRLDVRRGRDDEDVDAVVRVLRGPSLIEEDRRSRFLQDVQRAATVRAPGLCRVLDGGEEDSDLWVASAPPRGETLHELRRRARPSGGMTVAQVMRVGEAVARSLGALHDAEVDHKDINARSVFVDDDGAVLLDRLCAASLQRDERSAGDFGRRDDQQQLGALMWEALIDRRLLLGSVAPPSSLRADVPAAVDAVVLRALDADGAQPFETFAALADELRNVAELAEASGKSGDLKALVAGIAPTRAPERPQLAPPQHVDVPIFAADKPEVDTFRLMAGLAGLGVLALFAFALFAWWSIRSSVRTAPDPDQAFFAQDQRELERTSLLPDESAQDPAFVKLIGPTGAVERLPPTSPRVFQVWLQNCADCMPKFERARAARDSGELDDLPLANISFGAPNVDWAKEWRVDTRLVTDKGSVIVRPLNIGTFTAIVMFPDGRYRKVPVTEDGYGLALRRALREGPSEDDRRFSAPADRR